MKKIIITYLITLTTFIFSVTVSAQESIFETYKQAAIDAKDKGNYEEAVRYAKLAISEIEKFKNSSPQAINEVKIAGLNTLSSIFIDQKKYAEAEKFKREEVLLLERSDEADYPVYELNYPMSVESLGLILTEQNKFEEAEEVYRKALSYREKKFGANHKRTARSLMNLGKLYKKQKKYPEAEAMSRRAVSIYLTALQKEEGSDFDAAEAATESLTTIAQMYVEQKKYIDADKTYDSIIKIVEFAFSKDDEWLIEPLEERAKLLRMFKRNAEAIKLETRARLIKAKK
jgi:tetratricopeptide (TPR) repeat protein